jgi:Ser/Thr protein kinase RdoA (MazF antagonist)
MAAGGGWHHLVSSGAPKDEVAALNGLLDDFETRVKKADAGAFMSLRARVDAIDVCDDLPHCLVHPDMVPENAVETEDRSLVIIDWTNAGRGPRLWSLAMTLFAAGARDPRLVEKAISRYVPHSSLSAEELERLEGVLCARPLTIHAWAVVHGRAALEDSPDTLRYFSHESKRIAKDALAAFALERG